MTISNFRALLQMCPELDVVRIQDTVIAGQNDPAVLAWSVQEDRLLLTHDVQKIADFANGRTAVDLVMPGVLAVIP